MPANKINQPANTFVKGLITEASPLTFPENSSLDEVNFKLNRDGSRDKRWGQQYIYKEILPYTKIDLESRHAKMYKWEQPKGARKSVIGVVQIGYLLYFVDLTVYPTPSITSYDFVYYDTAIPLLNGGVALDASSVLSGATPVEFAAINGYLLLLNEEVQQPFIAWYDDEADVVYFDSGDILVRDIWGVDDGLGEDERPTELSSAHRYNLQNQGFTSDIVTTCGTPILDCIKSHFGRYPSNNDSWGVGRTADLTSADVYKFDPALAERNLVNNQPAAKGKYLIQIYQRGLWRNNLTGATVPTDLEESFFTTIETYAGRAWYSGIRGKVLEGDERSPNLCQAVVFSQVMETPTDLVRCYQEADPTSYEFNEVVDTDGGIIFINGCSFIHKLKAIKSSLWVFGDNGVWEIRGNGEQGFTATSFEVRKINSIGICSKNSVVDANGVIFYWSYSGIYAIQPDPNLNGIYNTVNVTLTAIQTKYDSIDAYAKQSSIGIYDPYNNKVRWLFSDTTPLSNTLLSGVTGVPGNNLPSNSAIVAMCNHDIVITEVMVAAPPTFRYILFSRRESYTPDMTFTYAYVYSLPYVYEEEATLQPVGLPGINQLTNGQIIKTSTSVADLWGQNVIYPGTGSKIYYFYRQTTGNKLNAVELSFDYTNNSVTLVSPEVTTTSTIKNEHVPIAVDSLSSSKFIVAFHDTSSKVSSQIINSNLTYGSPLASTNTANVSQGITQPLSIVALSSTKAVLLYKDSVWNGCTIDYLSVATNTISLSSATLFPNVTQMPTGTTTFKNQVGFKLSSTSFLVAGLLTNATVGYTNVLSCFIVTISGTTLTSTTILNLPSITNYGSTLLKLVNTNEVNRVILFYQDTDLTLKYVKLDTSGSTPVLVSNGVWNTDIANYSGHTHLLVSDNSILSAFSANSSLGFSSASLFVDETP